MDKPSKISIITPTFHRERYLERIFEVISRQTYSNWEWLVSDDSPQPSPCLSQITDERVRYFHSTKRITIGEKRNRMVEQARGEVILNFDDDDYYSPNYCAVMVDRLNQGFDFVKLSGWYVYSKLYHWFGYWDCTKFSELHYLWSRKKPRFVQPGEVFRENQRDNYLGYGFSYVFRKAVWEARPFDDANFNEDSALALEARQRFRLDHFQDQTGLCLHILHKTNASICYPQFRLPDFLLDAIFGSDVRDSIGVPDAGIGD